MWWAGDNRYYQGVIKEYDPSSSCHRVRYSANEWEFVRLSEEGYLINIDAEKMARLNRDVEDTMEEKVVNKRGRSESCGNSSDMAKRSKK